MLSFMRQSGSNAYIAALLMRNIQDGKNSIVNFLDDLKTQKSTCTSCQIEIHFSSRTSKLLIKYNLLRFQISGGLIIFFTEHDYKVSTSFINENKRYK